MTLPSGRARRPSSPARPQAIVSEIAARHGVTLGSHCTISTLTLVNVGVAFKIETWSKDPLPA